MAVEEALVSDHSKRRALARPLAVFACVTAAVALLGAPGGFIWAAVAPRVAVVVTGHGAAEVINPETKAFIAADGWFCLVGVIGGLLAGVAGYLVAVRRYGAVAVAGLITGGLAASLVEWWIGRNIGLASFRRELLLSHRGAVLHAPLVLRAHAGVVIWPLTSALVVGLVELLGGERRGERAPASPGEAAVPPGGGAAPPRTSIY